MIFTIVKGVGIFAVLCYVGDVLVRPTLVARKARKTADNLELPLLNVGAGTEHSSLRAYLFGPTTWGDYNVDIAITPPWFTPHAWTHMGHRWLMFGPTEGVKTGLPLWSAS